MEFSQTINRFPANCWLFNRQVSKALNRYNMFVPRKVRSLRCPTCSRIVLRDEPDFPFCSERCRRIDLGRWLDEKYGLPYESEDEEERKPSPPETPPRPPDSPPG